MKPSLITRILLWPFSLVYRSMISLRNIFYEAGLLKSTEFNIPVISVGNLSVGGTGKTPHIEYLVRLLHPYLKVATLSRGYKRKTKGFQWVEIHDTARSKGDEPLQFKKKFKDLPVAVSESRNIGIPLILTGHPDVQAILLDDAFQHRSVVPGLNILLTEYSKPFTDDWLLPAGRLREPPAAYERADIIVVTKCPVQWTPEIRQRMIRKIKPLPHQMICFSKYSYEDPYYIFDREVHLPLDLMDNLVLISAIASVDYLLDHLGRHTDVLDVIQYEDHHYFTEFEMEQLKRIYDNFPEGNTVFLTTEKDATRLELHRDFLIKNNIPIFVLPVHVAFLDDDKEKFDNSVREFLLSFKT